MCFGGSNTTTQQITIPPDVLARYNAVNAKAADVANTPFQSYTPIPDAGNRELVAPINAVEQGGINQASSSAGLAQPYYGAATGSLLGAQAGYQPYQQAATGYTLAGGQAVDPTQIGAQQINQFMNPYLGSVVGNAAALLNQQQQQEMSGQTGNAIRQGAFGGDRAGIAAANLAGQQSLAFNNAIAPLLSQGYNTALSAAQQQQGVNLEAQQANRAALQQTGQGLAGLGQQGYNVGADVSQRLAGLGTGAQAAAMSGAQGAIAAGQVAQQTQQALDTANTNQFLQQQAYPFQTTQFGANIAEGTGALSGQTQITNAPGSFLATGGRVAKATGGGLAAASMGGHVYPEHMGEGYAAGGGIYDPAAWAAILASGAPHSLAPAGGISGSGPMAGIGAAGPHYSLPSIAAPREPQPGVLQRSAEEGLNKALFGGDKNTDQGLVGKAVDKAGKALKGAMSGSYSHPDSSVDSDSVLSGLPAGAIDNSAGLAGAQSAAESVEPTLGDAVDSVGADSMPDLSDFGENRGGRIGYAGGGITGAEIDTSMPYEGGGPGDLLEKLDTAGASAPSLPSMSGPSGGKGGSDMGSDILGGLAKGAAGAIGSAAGDALVDAAPALLAMLARGGAVKKAAGGSLDHYPEYGDSDILSDIITDPTLRQMLFKQPAHEASKDSEDAGAPDPAEIAGAESPKALVSGLAPKSAPKALPAPAGANSGLLSKIMQGEGTDKFSNPYDTVYGANPRTGKSIYANPNSPLSTMNIGDVQDFQKDLIGATRGKVRGVSPDKGTGAVGAYQFTRDTLAALAHKLYGNDWRSTKFTPEVQDALAAELARERHGHLAGTWAAFRNEGPEGKALRAQAGYATGGLVGRNGYAVRGAVDGDADQTPGLAAFQSLDPVSQFSDDGDTSDTLSDPNDAAGRKSSKSAEAAQRAADAVAAAQNTPIQPKPEIQAQLTPQAKAGLAAVNATDYTPAPASAASNTGAEPTAPAQPHPDILHRIGSAFGFGEHKEQQDAANQKQQLISLIQRGVTPDDAYQQVFGDQVAARGKQPGEFGSFLHGIGEGKASTWVPLLAGLAGAATAPTRNFGTALLAGLGAGANAYQGQRKFNVEQYVAPMEAQSAMMQARAQQERNPSEIAANFAKAGETSAMANRINTLTPAELQEVRARGLHTAVINGGVVAFDADGTIHFAASPIPPGVKGSNISNYITGYGKPGINTPPAPAAPAAPATPATPAKPTGSPLATPGPKPATPAGGAPKAAKAPAAPAAQNRRWIPDATVDKEIFSQPQYAVGDLYNPAYNKSYQDRQEKANSTVSDLEKRSRQAAENIAQLERMESDIASPSNRGFLTAGSGAQHRLEIAKKANAALTTLGLNPLFNTAPGEEAGKLNRTMAGNLAHTLGDRTGSSVLGTMMAATPGIENSPASAVLIAEGLKAEERRNQTLASFARNFRDNNPLKNIDGYVDEFNKKNPVENWVRLARYSAAKKLMDKRDAEELFSRGSNPKVVEAFRRHYDPIYGGGFIQSLIGR